jgi:hypothetical protein
MQMENKEIIRQLNACADQCNHCFNECLNEEDVTMMARCIELDRECSDICQWTASFIARQSEYTNDLMQLCAKICEDCAEECAKHDNEHCRLCSEVCRKCAEVCHNMA